MNFYHALKALQSDVKNNKGGESPTTHFICHLAEFHNVTVMKEKSLMG